MDDKTKERLKQFLLEYIQLCEKHNMSLDVEGYYDRELEIMYETDKQWKLHDDKDFITSIHSLCYNEGIANIFDELKQSIKKDKL